MSVMEHKEFHHPFQPYDIQQSFMEAIYECIEQGKVGIFESPTGTGKSLSLICGSLTWLREHKRKTYDDALASITIDDDEPDWMAEHAKAARSREIRQMRAEFDARLVRVRERERKIKERKANDQPHHKRQKQSQSTEQPIADENEFLLDDYDSDLEVSPSEIHPIGLETKKLMEKLGMLRSTDQAQHEDDIEELKVYFCSRTHSQLSQFVGELQRVRLPPGLPPELGVTSAENAISEVEDLKHLTLGSRNNLCINPKVSKLPTQTAINERCIELQQSKTPADKKCSFLPNKEKEDRVMDFRDHALASIRDIEDLANLGSKLQICPYYASRPAIRPAEIVTLPYPLLLQKSARDALGISLKNHVVVIDEAHNLINAVEGTYSVQISDTQLKRAKDGLIVYLQRFRNRLKGNNRTYVAQVIRILDSLLQFAATAMNSTVKGEVTTPHALLAGKGVDQINLTKLVRYMQESKLARKVEGYIMHLAQAEPHKSHKSGSQHISQASEIPTLTHVENFLLALMNPSKEGNFLWSKESDKIIIQYLLLDPSEHFRQIVEDARSVILAGGTMSPMDDYRQQLFPYLPTITTFSCGHLISPSSLFVRAIASDGNGRLDFSFKARNKASALRLGNAIEKVARTVKGGLVVFLPSYGYLEEILVAWRSAGIMLSLDRLKPVFLDNRNKSAEEIFKAYSDAIHAGGKGAILLSVIGGKLSEGINFSDDLGRCVVVVGLPYPNLETPASKAKMHYLEEKAADRGQPHGRASREHAENVCMRSVNQAIGRAIRHKNDWASILLFDARYSESRIQNKLPGWIRSSFNSTEPASMESVVGDLASFFESKMGC